MESSPLVSVIMPNFNNGKFIREAIDSVLKQTYRPFELLVIDDCSTDDSVHVVQNAMEESNVVQLLKTSRRAGSAAAKNLGIRYAKGKAIAFLDSDDVYHPRKLELQVKALLNAGMKSIVYHDWYRIDEKGNILPEGKVKRPRKNGFIFVDALTMAYGVCTMFLIPREFIDGVGYFDETLLWAEDLDFTLKLAEKFEFIYIDEKLYGYRTHDSSKRVLIPRRERMYFESLVIRRYFERDKVLLDNDSKERVVSMLLRYYAVTKQYRGMASLWKNKDTDLKELIHWVVKSAI